MMKSIRIAASALLLTAPALAQSPDPHADHVMPGVATATTPPMDHSMMPNMDHGTMGTAAPAAAGGTVMPGMDHSKMNHGGMAMTPAPKGITRTMSGPAEAALQAFSDALEVGNRDLAIARLAPDLKVVEDGVEESLTGYVGGHLAADIAYQKAVKTLLLERIVVNESPTQTRIVSKLRVVSNRSDKMIDTLVDETAVLTKRRDGWKIARLEWVSAK
ncbi:MAG: hypothetical protein H7267_00470 [Sandarakinorhabdus sp.]|nr:hypothetical protein [Sandarakinorhabdus sp.]